MQEAGDVRCVEALKTVQQSPWPDEPYGLIGKMSPRPQIKSYVRGATPTHCWSTKMSTSH